MGVAVTIAVSVLAAGVGAPAGAGVRSADPGFSKNEIVIGRPTVQSGTGATFAKNVTPTGQAYIDEVNENGGINGRKVKQAIQDAGSNDAVLANAAVTKLRDESFVMTAADGTIFGPLAKRFKIPFFYGFGNEAESLNNKYAFITGTFGEYQARKLMPDFLINELDAKGKKIAIIYQPESFYGTSRTALSKALKAKGLNVVAEQPVDPLAPSCSQEVANVVKEKPDIVIPITLRATLCIFREAAAQGLETTWTGLGSTWLVGTFLTVPPPGYLDGSMAFQTNNTLDSKCGLEYQELMKRRLPDNPSALTDEVAFYSYLQLRHVVTELERHTKKGKNLTREAFVKALATKTKNFDDGCLAPMTWGPGEKRQGPTSVQISVIEGGKIVTKDPTWHKKF